MGIVWLPSADEAFINVLKYVEESFGKFVALQTADRLYSHIDLLSTFPRMGVQDERFTPLEIRYLVNTPNLIYYTQHLNNIIILSIFNTRQSPRLIEQTLDDILKTNDLL